MRNETKLAIGAGVGIAAAAGLLWYFSGGTSASGAQAISPYNPQGNGPQVDCLRNGAGIQKIAG